MAKPTKEQITLRAYQIWEANNKPEGRDESSTVRPNGSWKGKTN
jgi:hypothetical protein